MRAHSHVYHMPDRMAEERREERERWIDIERERGRGHTYRQTDGQRDRQSGRQAGRQAQTHRHRQHTDTQTQRQRPTDYRHRQKSR